MRPRVQQDAIRADVFRWLDDNVLSGVYEFSRDQLVNYRFEGERIPLLDAGRGIRNPRDFDATLTLMTSSEVTQYDDKIGDNGIVQYSYRTGDGGDNVKLRRAFELQVPLVYFMGCVRASSCPTFPCSSSRTTQLLAPSISDLMSPSDYSVILSTCNPMSAATRSE